MNGAVSLPLLGKDRRIAGGPFDSWDGFGIGICLDPGARRRHEATIDFPIEDFHAPPPDILVERLAAILADMAARPDDDLYVGCRAGYGRTGTLIAALATLAGYADPVAWVRAHYNAKAVETPDQAAAVAALDAGAVWSAFRARIGKTPAPLALYHYPDNASTLPHMLLREMGLPHELRLVDRRRQAQRDPDYLRLNPQGLIPVLVDGDLVVTETAAIVLHMLDRHPECGLAPALGTPDRAHFYKWMSYLTNTVQVEHLKRAYPDRHVTNPAYADDVRQTAFARLDRCFDFIEAELADRPFLLGDRVSAADHFLLMMVLWSSRMPRPADRLPRIATHTARMKARPAVAATLAAEAEAF